VMNFMVVDPRHEHAFRIPRPDLSQELGTRNACTDCHADKDAIWADEQMLAWYGEGYRQRPEFARALHAGRSGAVDAERRLMGLAEDFRFPGIARASGVALLPRYLSQDSLRLLTRRLEDADPLVRRAAVRAFEALPAEQRIGEVAPLLRDPVRTVRMEAAWVLADVPVDRLPMDDRDAFDSALADFVDAQMANADRPEAQLALGNLAVRQGRGGDARRAYEEAIRLYPEFVPAYGNLADLFRSVGQDEEAARVLTSGLDQLPGNAELLHVLGLLRVRQGRMDDALDLLSQAARQRPDDVRFGYVYAIALNGAGRTTDALAELVRVHEVVPADREVLAALVTVNRDTGDLEQARLYAKKLLSLAPDDPRIVRLAREVGVRK